MSIGRLGGQEPLTPRGESPKRVETRTPSPTSIVDNTISNRAKKAAGAAWNTMRDGDSKKTSKAETSRYSAMQGETAPRVNELAISQIQPKSESIEVDLEKSRLKTKRAELKKPLLKGEIEPSGFSRKQEFGAITRMDVEESRNRVKNYDRGVYVPPEYIPPKG